ncbi:MAG: AMP-binding protein [Rubrivivax sp.]|nr:AMP-binding protein [Rubrivivax sp.]
MQEQHPAPDARPAQARAAAMPYGSPTTLVALFQRSFQAHRELPACICMGRSLSFGQLDELSRALAAHLLAQGLNKGDRVAVMLPNVPQMLVTVAAVLRAGLVVVNLGPQLSVPELEHQLKDSGARAVVFMETEASLLQQLAETTPARHLVVASLGDLLGPLKGAVVNHWMRRVRRLVPAHELPSAVSFNQAIDNGRRQPAPDVVVLPDDIAALQYTGGTTGPSKGVVLLHRNLAANLLQSEVRYQPALARCPVGEQWVTVGALPLHHIFGFTLVLLLGLHQGSCVLLIPNAHDTAGMLKVLARHRFHAFPAINAMFLAVANHADVDKVDWSSLRLSLGGATAVEPATALLWLLKTGSTICQGYGLSEASPAVTCNPVDETTFSGHLGQPLPGTELQLVDDEGRPVPPGTAGEIAIRGPQVMPGYWQRPDETARVMTASGYLRSGDIGVFDDDGALRLVDRKKDLIFVSGFNVYPNEIEDVVAQIPGVRDCAAVSMPDALAGEAIKLVLVKSDPSSASPSEAEVRAWCEARLSGYKRPKVVEFRPHLPRTSVGKVLRRELREDA